MDFTKAIPFPDSAVTVPGCYSYLDCDVIIIDKYVPSRLDQGCLALAQDELPGGGTVVFFDSNYDGTLALRVPNDPTLTIRISIDGEEYDHVLHGTGDQPRYALVSGPFEIGCRVRLEILSGNNASESRLMPEPEPVPEAVHETASEPVPESVRENAPGQITEAVSEDSFCCAPAVPAHDAALQLKSMRTDNGIISFNDSNSRFLVALERESDAVTLSLPEGYEFETDEQSTGNTHTFTVNDTAFTGYEMRVYTPEHKSYRDFDLAIMQVPGSDAAGSCSVHAYTPIIGAFSGETCYIIDRTDSTVKVGTHGTIACGDVGIDPATGYKWGCMGPGSYFFELENGGYEILVSFTGEGARMIANPGTASEKVLVRESTTEEQRYGMRVTEGRLILSITSEDVDISTLVIRAIDTIAVESGYVPLRGKPADLGLSGGISIKKATPERSQIRPEVQTHINNKLAAKKNNDTVKTIGIATGAIAIAAGIFSLLGRDKD